MDDALYSAFGQRQVSTIFTQLNQYHVVLEVKPEYRRDADALDAASTCRAADGRPVPLAGVHEGRRRPARRSSINHQGQFPAATLSFNLAPGASLGEAVARGRATPRAASACQRASAPASRARPRRFRHRSPTRGG